MALAAAIGAALGDEVMTTTVVGGATRVELDGLHDWAPISRAVAEHDARMRLEGEVATFWPEDGTETVAGEVAGAKEVTRAGPIESVVYTGPVCTHVDLNQIAAAPDVLSVRLGGNRVEIIRVPHSDVKDGLSHLHRRGKVVRRQHAIANRAAICRASSSGLSARRKRERRRGVLARVFSRL
jgi:hypothetical protein